MIIGIRRFFRLALIVAVVAAASVGLSPSQQPQAAKSGAVGAGSQAPGKNAEAGASPVLVTTFTVVKGDVLRRLAITGELKAEKSVEIQVPRVRMLFSSMVTYLAPEGATIKQGERLVEFDNSSLISQKSDLERRLAEAKLKIDKQKADLEAQRSDLLNAVAQAEADLSVAQLYGKVPKDLLPANTYQQYQVNLDKAKLSLDKAKEQMANFERNYDSNMALVKITLEQAMIDMKRLDGDLTELTIMAPQDGIVIYGDNWASNRKIQVGDNIFPGQPVVTLPDLSTMQVVGYVYDTELGFLRPGMRCTFGLDPVPETDFAGEVASLTSVAARKGFASQQKVFKAVIKPDKVDLTTMKPGMTAHVEFDLKLASDVLLAPREYLGLDARRRCFVLKRKDAKTVSRQDVEVGVFGDRLVQILSGVAAGDALLPIQAAAEE